MFTTSRVPDYYATLEVLPTATHAEIKTSYYRLARKYHPDKNSGADATRKTQLINIAWEILGDEVKRAEYDLVRPKDNDPTRVPKHQRGPKHPENETAAPKSAYSNAKAKEDARAEAESQAKRREWLAYERKQDELIESLEDELFDLEEDITNENVKIEMIREMLNHNDLENWVVYLDDGQQWQEDDVLHFKIGDHESTIENKEFLFKVTSARIRSIKVQLEQRRYEEDARLRNDFEREQERDRRTRAETCRHRKQWQKLKLRKLRECDCCGRSLNKWAQKCTECGTIACNPCKSNFEKAAHPNGTQW